MWILILELKSSKWKKHYLFSLEINYYVLVQLYVVIMDFFYSFSYDFNFTDMLMRVFYLDGLMENLSLYTFNFFFF